MNALPTICSISRLTTFASVFHFTIIGARIVYKVDFPAPARIILSLFLLVLLFFTFMYFRKCHLGYIRNRNVQAGLQKALGVGELTVFPKNWIEPRNESLLTGFWGWGFYALYALGLSLGTLSVLWCKSIH